MTPIVRDVLFVATKGMAPPWHGRTKPLTPDETHVLRVATRSTDGTVTWKDVYAVLGERRATAALSKLKKAGGLEHTRYGLYTITEKGRIAIALIDAKAVWRPTLVNAKGTDTP